MVYVSLYQQTLYSNYVLNIHLAYFRNIFSWKSDSAIAKLVMCVAMCDTQPGTRSHIYIVYV